MSQLYPASFSEIRQWATANAVAVREARVRFALYAILHAVAASRRLSEMLVFKGGNALDFVYQPNRSTEDLDFTADMATIDPTMSAADLRILLNELFDRALAVSGRLHGVTFRVYAIKQHPPGVGRTFITFRLTIGYALPDEPHLRARLERGQAFARSIPLDISLNEVVCADERVHMGATYRLRVSTLEDIVAEKLRALLQQTIRNRTRCQDLLDLAVILRQQAQLNNARVAEFLQRKAAARHVPVSRAAFHDEGLAARAQLGYAELEQTTRFLFIPFEEALAVFYDFVDALPIQEE